MTRMVHDYPELRGMVGDMVENTKGDAAMAASSTKGGTVKTELDYDISGDQKGFAGTMDRAMTNVYEFFTGFSAADTSYDGNHELGHVLNSLLFASGDADRDWKYSITADEMLREVLKEDGVLSVKQRGKIVPRKKDSLRNNSPDGYYYKDQIDLGATGARKLGLTSGYGETDASEFFAEAFADVYAHGNKARKASIELVKKYEERMKKKRGGAARR